MGRQTNNKLPRSSEWRGAAAAVQQEVKERVQVNNRRCVSVRLDMGHLIACFPVIKRPWGGSDADKQIIDVFYGRWHTKTFVILVVPE